MRITAPLQVAEAADKVDILATAKGGGVTGQADALRLGIARALVAFDAELRPVLKKGRHADPATPESRNARNTAWRGPASGSSSASAEPVAAAGQPR